MSSLQDALKAVSFSKIEKALVRQFETRQEREDRLWYSTPTMAAYRRDHANA